MNLWEKICCFLSDLLNFSYGDPQASRGGNQAVTASYTAMCTAGQRSCLVMRNRGTVDIEYTTNTQDFGGVLEEGDIVTLYNFRGTMHARLVSGSTAGVINFLILGRWQ